MLAPCTPQKVPLEGPDGGGEAGLHSMSGAGGERRRTRAGAGWPLAHTGSGAGGERRRRRRGRKAPHARRLRHSQGRVPAPKRATDGAWQQGAVSMKRCRPQQRSHLDASPADIARLCVAGKIQQVTETGLPMRCLRWHRALEIICDARGALGADLDMLAERFAHVLVGPFQVA